MTGRVYTERREPPCMSCCTCPRSPPGSALCEQFHVHTCPIKISGSDFARWSYSIDILPAVRRQLIIAGAKTHRGALIVPIAAGKTIFIFHIAPRPKNYNRTKRFEFITVPVERVKTIVRPSNKLQRIRLFSVYKFNDAINLLYRYLVSSFIAGLLFVIKRKLSFNLRTLNSFIKDACTFNQNLKLNRITWKHLSRPDTQSIVATHLSLPIPVEQFFFASRWN